jgi:hypothetical protein
MSCTRSHCFSAAALIIIIKKGVEFYWMLMMNKTADDDVADVYVDGGVGGGDGGGDGDEDDDDVDGDGDDDDDDVDGTTRIRRRDGRDNNNAAVIGNGHSSDANSAMKDASAIDNSTGESSMKLLPSLEHSEPVLPLLSSESHPTCLDSKSM